MFQNQKHQTQPITQVMSNASTTSAVAARVFRVAIIGGGISGLTCAKNIVEKCVNSTQPLHLNICVFEKSYRPGGRLATRVMSKVENASFDHGAQYFTVRSNEFKDMFVNSWQQRGVVQKWNGKIQALEWPSAKLSDTHGHTDRYVGVPGMNSLVDDIAQQISSHPTYSKYIEFRYNTQVKRIINLTATPTTTATTNSSTNSINESQWQLIGEVMDTRTKKAISDIHTLGVYDVVVAAVPAPQCQPLLQDIVPELAAKAGQVKMGGCWATMIAFDQRQNFPFDAAFVNIGSTKSNDQGSLGHQSSSDSKEFSPLSWISRNSSKPQRLSSENKALDCWVLHSSAPFFDAHSEQTPENMAGVMTELFSQITRQLSLPTAQPVTAVAHRWRYSFPYDTLPDSYLWSNDSSVGACGDWCGGSRVEGAFLSGYRLGEQIANYLQQQQQQLSGKL